MNRHCLETIHEIGLSDLVRRITRQISRFLATFVCDADRVDAELDDILSAGTTYRQLSNKCIIKQRQPQCLLQLLGYTTNGVQNQIINEIQICGILNRFIASVV